VKSKAKILHCHLARHRQLHRGISGTVPYSSVITAQTTRLSSEETALTVLSTRLQASVALIEALGGAGMIRGFKLPPARAALQYR